MATSDAPRAPRSRLVALVAAGLALACFREPEQPRDLMLAPGGGVRPDVPVDTHSLGTDAAGAVCAALAPARQAVRGALRREVHLGAPGYGETPDRDERDTVVVLALREPLVVCPDPERVPADRAAIRVDRLQLLAPPRESLRRLGDTVTVFGRLSEAAFGFHYTPVVLAVDSIPALRPPPQSPTAERPALPSIATRSRRPLADPASPSEPR